MSRVALIAVAALLATTAQAADRVTRHPLPDSDFPISLAVETAAGARTLYMSGTVPPVVDEDAAKDSAAAYGDTETQTRNVLKAIDRALQRLGYSMGDVVKLRAFIAPPPGQKQVDFQGFMNAYTEFFGTADQPNLPARTAVPVGRLVNPGWLIEIEVTAAK